MEIDEAYKLLGLSRPTDFFNLAQTFYDSFFNKLLAVPQTEVDSALLVRAYRHLQAYTLIRQEAASFHPRVSLDDLKIRHVVNSLFNPGMIEAVTVSNPSYAQATYDTLVEHVNRLLKSQKYLQFTDNFLNSINIGAPLVSVLSVFFGDDYFPEYKYHTIFAALVITFGAHISKLPIEERNVAFQKFLYVEQDFFRYFESVGQQLEIQSLNDLRL